MKELLQLRDVMIVSNDNRINFCFPLIVLPGWFLPAESWEMSLNGEKGKLRKLP